ncbi:hypothetical protein EVA_01584 [gut metagenome]|uniref:Uncharacterized protein n=1 Tax=gut metagenome TaxID=749906 RepID=J9H7P7_9ZZZZ
MTIYYHFTKGITEKIYKKATARLYDEVHRPGKNHHGLLRNYTYQVNGVVTNLTGTLSLQIISVPWHQIKVDDIPAFE